MNKQELELISMIADRAIALYQRLGFLADKDTKFARTGIVFEIATVHKEIVPLRLAEMLASDDGNFAHDIGGIHRHLNFGTPTQKPHFSWCFMPRFGSV